MKKLLFFLMIAFSVSASCQILTIKNASFNDSVPVLSGSQQWIDVKDSVVIDSSGIARFFCANMDSSGQIVYNDVIFAESMNDFYQRPQNADGTFRIYFDVPWYFVNGVFAVNFNFSGSVRVGRVAVATSLPTLTLSAPIQSKTYYTLQGQITTDPHGLVIEYPARKLVYIAPRE